MNRRSLILWICALLTCLSAFPGRAEDGDGKEIVLRRFGTKADRDRSRLFTGSNLTPQWEAFSLKDGTPVGKVEMKKKDPLNDEANRNWYWIEMDVDAGLDLSETAGISLRLDYAEAHARGLAVELETTDGNRWRQQVHPLAFSGAGIERRNLPFSKFKSSDGSPGKVDPLLIRSIRLGGRGTAVDMLLERISFYREKKVASGWLSVDPVAGIRSPLFEPGEPVRMEVSLAKSPPATAETVDVVIENYWGEEVSENKVAVSRLKEKVRLEIPSLPPGYYVAKAYPLFPDGQREQVSCIKARGQQPAGTSAFAVMPASVESNRNAVRAVGEEAFFGIHGIKYSQELDRRIGVPWSMQYTRWKTGQPTPESDALARKISSVQAEEPWRLAVTSFAENGLPSIPRWALAAPGQTPGFADWSAYLGYVGMYSRYHARRFPHMQKRPYDCAWEIDLNRPGWHEPHFSPEEVVSYYRKIAGAIRENDPNAFIIGPCAHTFLSWIEEVFKAGLLDVVDGVSTHFYCSPPPETIRGDLVKLKALIRKYAGRDLPIYNTEAGFRSVSNGQEQREHAAWVARYNIIMKGEGVALNLTFYTIDFDSGKPGAEDSWGLGYNADDTFSYTPKKIAPKPALSAYATCVNQLLEAVPVGNINGWGNGIWGYVFSKNGAPLVALWRPEGTLSLDIPVGPAERVNVTDIMGRTRAEIPHNGAVTLEVGPDPLYLTGVDPVAYAKEALNGQSLLLYPGESRRLSPHLSSPGPVLSVQSSSKEITVSRDRAGALSLRASDDALPGVALITANGEGEDGSVRNKALWIKIGNPWEVVQVAPAVADGAWGLEVKIRLHGDLQNYKISGRLKEGEWQEATTHRQSGEIATSFVPLADLSKDPGEMGIKAELRIGTRSRTETFWKGDVHFLAATRPGTEPPRPLTNQSVITDSAGEERGKLVFNWDEKQLFVTVSVVDDVHHQELGNADMWRQDSVQLAFDTDPDHAYPYDFMTGNLKKKITEMAVSVKNGQPAAWRYVTYNTEELPIGDLSGAGVQVDWKRKEPSGNSRGAKGSTGLSEYRIAIPWKQIGLISPPQPGKSLGLAVLVNNSDGAGTKRTVYKLFDGIDGQKDAAKFGCLLLQ